MEYSTVDHVLFPVENCNNCRCHCVAVQGRLHFNVRENKTETVVVEMKLLTFYNRGHG